MASKRVIFARNLQRVFEKSHLTRAQLADICEVSTASVGDWLNAKTLPRLEKVSIIAKAMGVTEAELLTDFESLDTRRFDNREIADIAKELHDDPEARTLYEEISRLSPENKQALLQIARTMNLSQRN